MEPPPPPLQPLRYAVYTDICIGKLLRIFLSPEDSLEFPVLLRHWPINFHQTSLEHVSVMDTGLADMVWLVAGRR